MSGFYDFPIYPLPEMESIRQKIEGNGQRSILILYQAAYNQDTVMKDFLASIFGAAKISLADDAYLVNLASQERVLLSKLNAELSLSTVFAFGLNPADLGIQAKMPLYLPTAIGGQTYLFADDIALIFAERQEKGTRLSGALWKAIRQLFVH